MICDECGAYVDDGVCDNCGLIIEDHKDMDYGPVWYGEEVQHGAPMTNKVPDMAVMTHVNMAECTDPVLRRALRWDGYFGWDVQKTMILNKKIKYICKSLKLDELFIDNCYYFFRKYKDKLTFSGKSLEDVALALVYLFLRVDNRPYTLLDFKRLEYNTQKIWNIYIELVKKLNLMKKIRAQDPGNFVKKAVDYIYYFNQFYTNQNDIRNRYELIKTVKEQFTGIYRSSNGFIDLSNAGLVLVGAILYSCTRQLPDWRISQKEVANACGVSDVTLRKYINKLQVYYGNL